MLGRVTLLNDFTVASLCHPCDPTAAPVGQGLKFIHCCELPEVPAIDSDFCAF
jgi:hypothetical protein